jgi:hypothetical protein
MIRTAGKIRWRSAAVRVLIATAAAVPLTVAGVQAGARAADAGWVAQIVPPPPHASGASLGMVSCLSPSACIAIGGAHTRTHALAYTESWNGTSWTVGSTIPHPANTSLFDFTCTSLTDCVLVGRVSSGSTLVPFAEQWNGTSWTAQRPPAPANAVDTTLDSVSCTGPARCVAVGYSAPIGGGARAFSEVWNGSTWTPHLAPSPAPANVTTELLGVSCRPGRSCEAVGEYESNPGSAPLAESWDGHRWAIQTVPSPSGAIFTTLGAVSCRFAAACTAVGNAGGNGASQPLAEQWNGTAWTIARTPHLSGGRVEAGLDSVSCPLTVWCTATGSQIRYGREKLLAEHWNGTRWTIAATVPFPHAQLTELGSVSCPVRGSCVAVGSLVTGPGKQRALAEENP